MGLSDIRIGDVIGEWSDKMKDIHFAEPQMEAAIEARPKGENHNLYQALVELSEEDPLIKVVKDDIHNEIYIRLLVKFKKK